MATSLDLPVDQGSDITYRFQAFDVNDAPFSLAGAVVTLVARVSETDPNISIELTSTTKDIQVVDAEAGIWAVHFAAGVTTALQAQPYPYQQYATFSDGSIYRLSQGTIYLDQEIAR